MEVLVAPTFGIDASSSSAYVVAPQDKHLPLPASLFLKEEDDGADESPVSSGIGSVFGMGGIEKSPNYSSENSSSIGGPDDSDEEEEDEDSSVVSSKGAFSSLDSLEESLPIKRGLSNFFSGKSKSFANLSDVSWVSNMKNLEKPENSFNKRRRILMANKWSSRKSSNFPSLSNPKSMPLLTFNEDDQEEEERPPPPPSSPEKLQEEKGQEKRRAAPKQNQYWKFKTSFKSQSCYCLTDLQEAAEEEYQ